jgi:predicted naringenin-chalcone synthase
MGNDPSLIVSDALFGDGAAAAIIWNRPGPLAIIDSRTLIVPEYREEIRFVYKGGQLHNQLSTKLVELVGPAAGQVVRELLEPLGLQVSDITHWALHSGGEKIINAVRDDLNLNEGQLIHTRYVLENMGNMSSPTVWFVVQEILNSGIKSGDYLMMVAFGAGLSAHSLLLQAQ